MVKASILFSALAAVFAGSSYAAGIGVDGNSCGGDPSITDTVFTIMADSDGGFCSDFTDNIPGGSNGGGTPILSLTFTSDLSAGMLSSDYTCSTDIFTNCNVATDPNAELLTITFSGIPFVGTLDIRGSGGIGPGDTFYISLTDFTPLQNIDVAVNSPEPQSLILLLLGGSFWLLQRRQTAAVRCPERARNG